MNEMSTNQALMLACVMSLVGGLVVALRSVLKLSWFGTGAPFWDGYNGYLRGAMVGYHNFMGG